MNMAYLQAAAETPPLPGSAKTPPLPGSAKNPPLPESAKTPPLPESAKIPPLPESAKIPPLPESAKSPSLPESSEIPPLPESSPTASHHNLEEIAKKEKARLEDLLKRKGGQAGFYPRFTVAVKGQKVGSLSVFLCSLFPFHFISFLCLLHFIRGEISMLV